MEAKDEENMTVGSIHFHAYGIKIIIPVSFDIDRLPMAGLARELVCA